VKTLGTVLHCTRKKQEEKVWAVVGSVGLIGVVDQVATLHHPGVLVPSSPCVFRFVLSDPLKFSFKGSTLSLCPGTKIWIIVFVRATVCCSGVGRTQALSVSGRVGTEPILFGR
jgi:hypothetical protein